MIHPDRVLRSIVEDKIGPPCFTSRQQELDDRILEGAERMMAHVGRHGARFAGLAVALRISANKLRWHYTDLDALLGEILRRHLRLLADALARVPHEAPNRQILLRQAYLAATRGAFGRISDAHRLLIRDRHQLPPDQLDGIEQTYQALGESIAGDLGPEALSVLEQPWADAHCTEPVLTALATAMAEPPAPRAAEPSPPAAPAIQAPLGRPATPVPANVAEALRRGDLSWLRPAGLCYATDPDVPVIDTGPGRPGHDPLAQLRDDDLLAERGAVRLSG